MRKDRRRVLCMFPLMFDNQILILLADGCLVQKVMSFIDVDLHFCWQFLASAKAVLELQDNFTFADVADYIDLPWHVV